MSTQTDIHRAAHNRWARRRRRLIAMGQWEPFVDAEPIRQRVRALNQTGMPTNALALRLGLPESALEHLMWKRDGVASKDVRRETAEAVMGYWPTLEDFPANSLIDGTGVRRRVQALMTLGWTRRALASKAGISERSLSRALHKGRVTAELTRQVSSVYDLLWMRGPASDEVSPLAAHRARVHAANSGFAGPLAWDDDTIDDPSALPQTDAESPLQSDGENLVDRWLMGEAVVLRPEDRKKVVQHLFEWTNDTPEEIAARVEMSVAAVWQTWTRIKRKAREEGRPVPWRRVYMPRGELKQNEMEEAA